MACTKRAPGGPLQWTEKFPASLAASNAANAEPGEASTSPLQMLPSGPSMRTETWARAGSSESGPMAIVSRAPEARSKTAVTWRGSTIRRSGHTHERLSTIVSKVLARITRFSAADGTPIHLEIKQGDVVRLVGPNGSGKTSLLRALAGLEAPLQPDHLEAERAGLAMQEARDSLIGLTVSGEYRLRQVPTPSSLSRPHQDVATLSSGEARKLAIDVALRQPLLLLDEPTEGLDPASLGDLEAAITQHAEHGAVVIADHGDRMAHIATQTVSLGAETWSAMEPFTPGSGPRHQILGAPREPGLHAFTGPNGSGKTTALKRTWRDHPEAGFLSAPSRDALHGERVRDCLAHAEASVVQRLVPPHLMDRHPLHLSGGEAQRVALAAALGKSQPLSLLDEPEAHLDANGRRALHAILRDRIASGACVVVATHDPALIAVASSEVRF